MVGIEAVRPVPPRSPADGTLREARYGKGIGKRHLEADVDREADSDEEMEMEMEEAKEEEEQSHGNNKQGPVTESLVELNLTSASIDKEGMLPPIHSTRPKNNNDQDVQTGRVDKNSKGCEPTTDIQAISNGLCGLKNMGNTCYMNSCLQCLSHVAPFIDFFLQNRHVSQVNRNISPSKGELVDAYANLVQNMWRIKEFSCIKPGKLKKSIGAASSFFQGYQQHDAQEFLRFFLDGLHEDLNRIPQKVPYEEIKDVDGETVEETAHRWWKHYEERNDSHIKDTFSGQLFSATECKKCGNQSHAFDPILDISVPIPSTSNLEKKQVDLRDCLQELTKKEQLDGDNKSYCGKCKEHQPSTRTLRVYRAPPVLVVHLKRFSQNGMHRSKLSTRVNLPTNEDLDIADFCHKPNTEMRYELVGMVNHMGTMTGGHYTANAKNARTGLWYNFNDETVSKVDPNNFDTSTAYMLFFKKKEQEQKKSNL